MSREQVLEMIRDGLTDVEAAVHNHPPETVAVYEMGTAAFRRGQDRLTELPEHLEESGLTLSEAKIVFSYLHAMAFMSAWYHLYGEKENRDKSTNNAAILVGGTGLNDEFAFKLLLEYEHNWRGAIQRSSMSRHRTGCLGLFLVAATLAFSLVL